MLCTIQPVFFYNRDSAAIRNWMMWIKIVHDSRIASIFVVMLWDFSTIFHSTAYFSFMLCFGWICTIQESQSHTHRINVFECKPSATVGYIITHSTCGDSSSVLNISPSVLESTAPVWSQDDRRKLRFTATKTGVVQGVRQAEKGWVNTLYYSLLLSAAVFQICCDQTVFPLTPRWG